MTITTLVTIIGLVFSPIAAVAAFLITYEGYLRGQNPDRKLAFKVALQAAFIAFAVFVILAIGMGLIVGKIV